LQRWNAEKIVQHESIVCAADEPWQSYSDENVDGIAASHFPKREKRVTAMPAYGKA
jgi:IS30 family transposase